jgi:hypothetical protein
LQRKPVREAQTRSHPPCRLAGNLAGKLEIMDLARNTSPVLTNDPTISDKEIGENHSTIASKHVNALVENSNLSSETVKPSHELQSDSSNRSPARF